MIPPLFGGAVLAQAEPSASLIRTRIEAAAGPRPTAERLVVTSESHGLHTRVTTYRLGDDEREVEEDGPFQSQRGVVGKAAWHQNENGETVLEQPDPGRATQEIYKTVVTAIQTPVAGYLLASLNAAGSGTKEYVDVATWRIVRRDVIRPDGTTTYAYEDFRTVAGVTKASHWTVRDGHPENDEDYRIESDTSDVRPSDVAIAPPLRALVEFPAGKRSVALPVRLERDKFYVRLIVNGRGLDFLLDTGTGGITIDDDVARQLGLAVYGRYSTGQNAGRYVSGRVLVPEVAIGDLTMHQVAMTTIPHVRDDGGDIKPVGLLGFDFIGAVGLKLDYQHGSLTAFDQNAFVAPNDPHVLALDVRLGSQVPMTDVTINKALGERFLIDTGSSSAVMIHDYFRRRHPEALVDRGGGGAFRDRRYFGAGGAFETQPFQLDSVIIGNYDFKDFVAFLVRSRGAYSSDADGVVGTDFLRLFTIYLDYADSSIYLERNGLGATP